MHSRGQIPSHSVAAVVRF